VTKPIYPLHHIDIPLFAILFDLVCSLACFPACQSPSREQAGGELPRHRLRAAASGICRQVSLMHFVPIFLYLSIGLHASSY
jgi:hypothetical protein